MGVHCKVKFKILIIAAILLFAIAFSCVLFCDFAVVRAENGLQFEITLRDSDTWVLVSNNAEIASFEGDFFYPSDDSKAASVAFKHAIDDALLRAGETDYTLKFVLPDIGLTTDGSSNFNYTEQSGRFVLKGIYKPLISDDVIESLQYRTSDGAFVNYTYSTKLNGGLAFGQMVDVGDYFVRFVAWEIFTFDGNVYRVPRCSQEATCTVKKAKPSAPALEKVTVEYGTAVKDIVGELSTESGAWKLSEIQTESDITSSLTYLHVRPEGYRVNFDFIPHNPNYDILTGVEISVNISPRTLRVAIDDAFSLLGEPLADGFHYSILTSLVGDDCEPDLGVRILTDDVNTAVAGDYVLTALFDNPDYVAYSMSVGNALLGGGRYTVYDTVKTVIAPDGMQFEVFLGTGFRDLYLRIELCTVEWWTEFALYNNTAYRFVFENAEGSRVFPSGSFTVKWGEGAFGNVTHAGIALKDGEALTPVAIEDRWLTVGGDTDIIAFLISSAPVCKAFGIAIASIVMIALCCALGVTLIVLTIVYFAGRRYFK